MLFQTGMILRSGFVGAWDNTVLSLQPLLLVMEFLFSYSVSTDLRLFKHNYQVIKTTCEKS